MQNDVYSTYTQNIFISKIGNSMKELKGKWALVTGASSGIGADLARLYAKAGCHLIITARREQRLAELKKELSQQNNIQIEIIQNDLSTETGPQELFDAVEDKKIQVSILVNNAGIALSGKFSDIPLDKKLGIIQLNLVSLTKLTHLFLQGMISRKEGWIMQVASVYGFQPGPNMATYAATKAYVISLSEALNYELKGTGVKHSVLCPGPTRTEIFDTAGHTTNILMDNLSMDSMDVAKEGFKGLLNGKSVIVPGAINKALVSSNRFSPRALTVFGASLFGKEGKSRK
ncbi:MAG: short-subunit dehydrogenase [Paraglaciecola sp.]